MKLKSIYNIVYNAGIPLQMKKAHKHVKYNKDGGINIWHLASSTESDLVAKTISLQEVQFIQLENVCHFSEEADKVYRGIHRKLIILPNRSSVVNKILNENRFKKTRQTTENTG